MRLILYQHNLVSEPWLHFLKYKSLIIILLSASFTMFINKHGRHIIIDQMSFECCWVICWMRNLASGLIHFFTQPVQVIPSFLSHSFSDHLFDSDMIVNKIEVTVKKYVHKFFIYFWGEYETIVRNSSKYQPVCCLSITKAYDSCSRTISILLSMLNHFGKESSIMRKFFPSEIILQNQLSS